jgi:hypothetical protein
MNRPVEAGAATYLLPGLVEANESSVPVSERAA